MKSKQLLNNYNIYWLYVHKYDNLYYSNAQPHLVNKYENIIFYSIYTSFPTI